MGKMMRLRAKDGHELDAYVAEPKGKAKGGVVVVQEVFGVTDHVKRVADQYAARGYKAVAPAMFDRIERDLTVPYTDVQRVHAPAAVAEHARRRGGGRERSSRGG
jgi:carboxymethylenebutenolidase